MKSKKVNKAWLHDHIHDPYVKLARHQGYRARAVYKLKEIDESFQLIHSGMTVVDLGSAPGAWSQYLRERLLLQDKNKGRVIALDLLPMDPIEGVEFIQGDFREEKVFEQLIAALGPQGPQVDVVVSDMAPNLSGISCADASRIAHLAELVLEFSMAHLHPQGAVVLKLFHGSGYSQVVKLFKDHFQQVKPFKPKASRDRSSETFLWAKNLKKH